MITFTIDDVEYQAESGMTWETWCDSTYNSNGTFHILNGQVFYGEGTDYGIKKVDSIMVEQSSYKISNGGEYVLADLVDRE